MELKEFLGHLTIVSLLLEDMFKILMFNTNYHISLQALLEILVVYCQDKHCIQQKM